MYAWKSAKIAENCDQNIDPSFTKYNFTNYCAFFSILLFIKHLVK
jgi:hypothetical protein